MRRAALLLLFGVLASASLPTRAQMLDARPVPVGGDPVGIWEADSTSIQAYAAPELLAAVKNLNFGGSVSGKLTMAGTGSFEADYIVRATVTGSLGIIPIQADVTDTTRLSGRYQVADSALVLIHGTNPVLQDTIGFSVAQDTLLLVEKVPLKDYEDLVGLLAPTAGPPLAVLKLVRTGMPEEPAGTVTTDFDGDGWVNFGDFVLFAQHFGTQSGEAGFETQYDLNADGRVGFTDFVEFAEQFGRKA
ncbi:MAG: dockerin type I domain-containing protein [Candidatus Latescibacteria bacterium]|jgi:hypothetical protein|nr:dockerin type I domain-containing protein [Candidatus Latescibacterota bacterium]